jgi:hypothetical protein
VPAAGIATVDGRPYFPQTGQPHDRCLRCGRATPLGVSLCDADNPAHIGAPSTTQVHGTILLGVIIGFVLIAFGAKLLVLDRGPFEAALSGRVARVDGAVDVVLQVTNRGRNVAPATCRVGAGGQVAQKQDLIFLTDPLQPGVTASFSRTLPTPLAGDPPWVISALSVTCT